MPLVSALVDRLARGLELRVLFIKGPALEMQGLRGAHDSVDVDVLVHPHDRARLLSALAVHGWRVAVEPTSALILPLHSTTVRHSGWMCEIDVHDRFPGFLAEPGPVFEALWGHRTSLTIAGRQLPAPDVVAHAAVAALHWLRDGPGYHQLQLHHLCRALDELLDDGKRQDLVTFAAETGSTQTLRPVLDRLGVDIPIGDPHDDTYWKIRTASTGVKSVGWVTQLGRAPWRRRPALLVHALLLTEAEIRNEQPSAAPGAWGLFVARMRRLRYGLRDLPRAARIIRRARQER